MSMNVSRQYYYGEKQDQPKVRMDSSVRNQNMYFPQIFVIFVLMSLQNNTSILSILEVTAHILL